MDSQLAPTAYLEPETKQIVVVVVYNSLCVDMMKDDYILLMWKYGMESGNFS